MATKATEFGKLDGNSLLKAQFVPMRDIQIMRNPDNSRPIITNVHSQLFANRTMSCLANWTYRDEEVQFALHNFAPARNPQTGEIVKDFTKDLVKWYQIGLPDSELARQEFGLLLSYYTACFSTGVLPTPSKPSGQSTIMAKIVQNWRESTAITPNWIDVIGKNEVRMRLDRSRIDAIQTIFVANYDFVLANWEKGDRKGGNTANRITWIE
jgi:hypothetical protein